MQLSDGCTYCLHLSEIYDSLVIIKGPQSVQHGAGNSAATILFERRIEKSDEPGYRLHASATAASVNRLDEVADLQIGNSLGYLQLNGTNSSSDDYKDGDGNLIHSEYNRYSGLAALGWTPDNDTRMETSVARSDGEAAYADRSMDGTQFLRDSVNFRAERKNISDLIGEIKFHVYGNEIDHIMDDQELRKPGMMGYANLKRDTSGAKLSSTLLLNSNFNMVVGLDTQQNGHESRSAPVSGNYSAWLNDADIEQVGIFSEFNYSFAESRKLVWGYRLDQWEAIDKRSQISMGMMKVPNPTANQQRKDDLNSWFGRYEWNVPTAPTTLYVGFGHSERFPDYWEIIAKESSASRSAFNLAPEETNQWDVGAIYKTNRVNLSASVFYNNADNFILADYTNPMKMNGVSRNIDETTYGGEIGANVNINSHWKVESSVSYVRGENNTDDTALAQIPPLEARLALTYSQPRWSVGGLMRLVDGQDRYDLNKGNIVGKDIGPSAGFGVFSFNANWKVTSSVLASAGIDNMFDKNYAEFISRSSGNGMGGAIPGYVNTMRVNEPGRTFWLKFQLLL